MVRYWPLSAYLRRKPVQCTRPTDDADVTINFASVPVWICVSLALLISHVPALSLQPARSLQMSPDYTGSPFYPKELYCHIASGSGMESKKCTGGPKR